jgi:hypothetical protein
MQLMLNSRLLIQAELMVPWAAHCGCETHDGGAWQMLWQATSSRPCRVRGQHVHARTRHHVPQPHGLVAGPAGQDVVRQVAGARSRPLDGLK